MEGCITPKKNDKRALIPDETDKTWGEPSQLLMPNEKNANVYLASIRQKYHFHKPHALIPMYESL